MVPITDTIKQYQRNLMINTRRTAPRQHQHPKGLHPTHRILPHLPTGPLSRVLQQRNRHTIRTNLHRLQVLRHQSLLKDILLTLWYLNLLPSLYRRFLLFLLFLPLLLRGQPPQQQRTVPRHRTRMIRLFHLPKRLHVVVLLGLIRRRSTASRPLRHLLAQASL